MEFTGRVTGEILASFPLSRKQRLREVQETLGMDVHEVAALCRVDSAAVVRWTTGKIEMPEPYNLLIGMAAWLNDKHPLAWSGWLNQASDQS